ncbi:ImmA/IrrE family metallo-endopeptidase [soil metagenome]
MHIQKPYTPKTSSHPGETLADKLEELGIGPKEFAVRADKPEKTITAILNGESAITPDMAIQFERVLGITANFWLQRQVDFDEAIARAKEISKLSEAISWMKNFPIKEMIGLKWLPDVKTDIEKSRALLGFFGIASSNAWDSYYMSQKLKVAFRISLATTKQAEPISAWLRRGELLAAKLEAPKYDKSSFENILPDLKKIMVGHPKNFAKKIQSKAIEAGVKVVYSTCLPKAPLNGATRWIGNNPVIQLSGRLKRNDIFWFTLFHEAGHIVKHGKKDIFLEEIEYSEKDLQKEKEADEFARKCVLTDDQFNEVTKERYSAKHVIECAEKFNTHPAIIIGRLQREDFIGYNEGTEFFEKIDLD